MKAVTYCKTSDRFQLRDVPTPKRSNKDVLVRVLACGLNPIDTKIPHWHHLVGDMDDDFIVGLDVVGEITEVSDEESSWRVGDKVLFHGNMFRKNGGLAEYCLQNHQTLTLLPDVSTEFAASTPCAGWTAWRALVDKLCIQGKESILITGGSGGVGSFAIQLAKYFGVDTIIVSCSKGNSQYVKQLGATHVIDYHTQDVVKEVMTITGHKGVNVALDCVGGESELFCANSLQFDGAMVELVETADLTRYQQAKARGLSVHQLSLGAGYNNGQSGLRSILNAGEGFNKLLDQNRIQAPYITSISLSQAGDKLLEMRNQRTVGKVVVILENK
ncbi:zinc-binding dehydrogenase [Vibrio superstes]|uniref:Alcohol dehydrogenase n=1 Tax=Vibrio superstes NBRC 103154 TaxID=1219062 RepID=A0A511QP38_9VIBR|nr:zinc-binding dehydrogenase [Vibrio superstes]GEM79080.1 alcohol dehydrogenase [Vibrio superstes NBRC 103154]